MDDRAAAAAALAADILTLSKNTLMLSFRFLDRALAALTPQVTETPWFANDGQYLYYEPWYILGQYKTGQTVVTRDCLHTLLHCVLRHGFVGKNTDTLRWDLACDIAVENIINGLDAACVRAARTARQIPVTETVRAELESLTAERIYKWLGDKKISPEEMAQLRLDFIADEHGLWYGKGAENRQAVSDRETVWREVSRRMQTELETVLRDKDSPLIQSLRSINRVRHDYTEFLRRFGRRGEIMRLSDEEFDINYYSYGMELYGDIPLIEPLEYRDERRIRSFVIAVDTSGSVKGEVVQSFIQHTHDILCRHDSFHARPDLHIIQCDDRIREDAHIRNAGDFQSYIAQMEIKGLGRTDFRPVFGYVEELRKRGGLSDMCGLIYFTDGKGIFPEKPPDYDTAFILHCDTDTEPELPPWAIKLILSEDDILDKRFASV